MRVNCIAPAAATRLTATVPRDQPQEVPAEDEWSPMHPKNMAPFVAYLSTESCPIHGRVFFVHAGTSTCSNRSRSSISISKEGDFWTVEELQKEAPRLQEVDLDVGHPMAAALFATPPAD